MSDKTSDSGARPKRTVVMNSDVVLQIFSNLEINELIRLERVSKQFQMCANYWFRRLKNISINSAAKVINQYLPIYRYTGPPYAFPNKFFVTHLDGKPCLIASKQRMLWLSEKFPIFIIHCRITV